MLPGIANAYNPKTIYNKSFKHFDEILFKVDIDIESSPICTTTGYPNSRVSKFIKSLQKICDMHISYQEKSAY